MGLPAIVGCGDATAVTPNGTEVTVACCEGEVVHVYPGSLATHVEEMGLGELPSARVRILMNVGNPEEAFNVSATPCDGVGPARLEFIIANHIKVHPMALLHPERASWVQASKEPLRCWPGATINPGEFYVDRLA